MKTTFARLFGLIAGLVLLCVLFLGAGFRALLSNYLISAARESLSNNAQAVAELASAYDTTGQLEDNWDFRISLSFASHVAENDAVICDENGRVILCSCEDIACPHLGTQLDPGLTAAVLLGGETYAKGDLKDLYDSTRYYVATPVVSRATGESIGFVVVSTPAEEAAQLMGPMFQIFLITAGVVLLVALAASSILARYEAQQLKDLAETAHRFGHGDLRARAKVDEGGTVEMHELAAEFNNMAASLEQSEIRRREFVANVSHELKTPMTTIAGFMDGMLDGTIPPERHRQYMQTVSDEVRRLSRLVRSMLDISRLQSQGIPEQRKRRFDIVESVGQVLISFEQKINDKHIEVEADLPDEGLMVWADSDAITQVIYNLTDNAVKFCPQEGQLWVRVAAEGQRARVTVGNTGPTIPPEELPLVFDRFHKMDKSRSVDRDGYGLGLYIVKTIIEGHGEDIYATSKDGRTEFSFTLPIRK
ncbi:sensor histidine kinase [Candidatus Avoscillospira sp. LCP25S3_F1]|uniref:sensor histidine kinase n=1 Tax=Candidatus Avoscillospira sp. LCP25S3_F1 TaxID=3438825 RepID=UPI003F8E75A1